MNEERFRMNAVEAALFSIDNPDVVFFDDDDKPWFNCTIGYAQHVVDPEDKLFKPYAPLVEEDKK